MTTSIRHCKPRSHFLQNMRAPDRPLESVCFAGLRFDNASVDDVVARLTERDPRLPFAYLTTPNAEHVYFQHRTPTYCGVTERAWLSSCDSRVLRRIAHYAGVPLQFAPGAYVVDRLFLNRVIARDDPITIIGSTPEVAAVIAGKFGLTQIAQHIPPMGFIKQPAMVQAAIDFVVAHPARFVFITMGPPHSDILARMIHDRGDATGTGLCVGGSLTMLADLQPRAPGWMERHGLVWLFRLCREPRRLWRRYLSRSLLGAGIALRHAMRRMR